MFKLLKIKNIALIESLELELGPGLTLLTGETGAGKSIVVDALGLLLGARASADLIRTGADQATVEALVESREVLPALEAHGLPVDGDEVVLRREISAAGKGRCTVNGALAPVSLLRALSPSFAVIHGQHEPQGLLDPNTHLALLDRYAGLSEAAAGLGEPFSGMRAAEAALEALLRDRREAERRRESLEHQASEIERARLEPGEEERLRQEKVVQANAGRLAELATEGYALVYEDEGAVLSRLGQVYRRVEELASIDPRFAPFLETRAALKAQVEDLAYFLRDYRDGIELSPGRLDAIETRLAQLERLKRKYGATVEEVIEFGARCRSELEALGAPEERERILQQDVERSRASYLVLARELSERRRAAARELQKKAQAELAQLAMEKTRLRVRFEPEEPRVQDPASWSEAGLERAELLLSPNPGEDLRPLARIASGGELSRILLALNSVASVEAAGKTLVFDEVDAGIGGRVAEVVGRKLKAIAARHQVLCVTHLPQIASLADRHFVVRKRVERGRTFTEVEPLAPDQRIEEVARMLGGETVTDAARRHAREMVRQGAG